MKAIRLIIALLFIGVSTAKAQQPNIIFVICDDLNDAIEGMGGHPQAQTPRIDSFMQGGVHFTAAQCNAPICGPSRASLISGLYPHTTGLQGYEQNKNKWDENALIMANPTMHAYMKNNGYSVYGTGKIHHGTQITGEFDDFGIDNDAGPWPWDGTSMSGAKIMRDMAHTSLPAALKANYGPLSDVPQYTGNEGWWNQFGTPFNYVDENNRDQMTDELSVDYAANILSQTHTDPFFITVGFVRPHSPYYAPQKFFDMYGIDTLQLAPWLSDDLDDVATGMVNNSPGYDVGSGTYDNFLEVGAAESDSLKYLKEWTRAYLACVSYVDYEFGRLMDSLNNSAYASNTIVIFTSDHGYHMREKNSAGFKNTGWSEVSHIPYVISGPGFATGVDCGTPVSLVDLYPTIADFAGLTIPAYCEGHSVKPLCEDPVNGTWTGPQVAVTSLESHETGWPLYVPQDKDRQHYSARSEKYHYILTAADEEELYDMDNDPHEWTNLAGDASYDSVRLAMRAELLSVTGRKAVDETNTNLLYNGEFENDLNGWKAFLNGGAAGEYWADTNDAYSGNRGVYFKVDVTDNPWNHHVQNDNFAVEKDKTYKVTYWARSEGGTGTAQVFVKEILSNTKYIQETPTFPDTWTQYQMIFTAAQTTNRDVRIDFQYTSTGTFYLDEVIIEEVDIVTPQFCNGDFELGDYTGWGQTASNGAAIDFLISDTTGGEGVYSSYIDVNTLGLQPWHTQITSSPEDFSCLDSIKKNEDYVIAFKAKSNTGTPDLKVAFSTVSPVVSIAPNNTFTLTNDWVEYTVAFTSDTTLVASELRLKMQFLNADNYQIDSVSLRSTTDCNGDLGGTAYYDVCGVCVEGNTGEVACTQDCNGDWGGDAYLDNCSNCVDGLTGNTPCTQDCNSEWGGTAAVDSCGICAGGTTGITFESDPMNCTVGIDGDEDIAVAIYPNPSNQAFNVKMEGGQIQEIIVTDQLGVVVESRAVGGNSVAVGTNLKPGVYFILVKGDGLVYVEKIVKQ